MKNLKFFLIFIVFVISILVFYNQWEKLNFFQFTRIKCLLPIESYKQSILVPTSPTVFCLIKTYPNNIKKNKTLNIFNVWAKKCDNYRFVTLLPEHLRPKNASDTIEVFENFYMIQPKGLERESHSNLTLKIYYSMVYVYKNLPSYDWYYIVDDDAYVNVANLKEFLKDKLSNKSITYGYNFKRIVSGGYHSGGPGYVLSNAAFMAISKAISQKVSNCPNRGIDDVDVNACVRKYKGVKGKSIDEFGRERFLVLGLMTHFKGNYPPWLYGFAENPLRKGLNCCSDSLIAVHYMSPTDVFRLDLAIEVNKNVFSLYNEYQRLKIPVTFKNIIKNYILLEDIEQNKNKYISLINF